jgi:hypothetical protein
VIRAATRLLVLLLGILGTLSVAGPASAHVGGGAAGSDFDGRIDSVRPAMPGVTVRILQFGDDLEIVNASSSEVLVPGYFDEPYLRIGPSGVWRNLRSPATYINTNRFGQVTLPSSADPQAAPDWVRISTEPQYVWHDHRTHWMSQNLLPPAVAADPSRGHLVSEWKVPLRYGDTAVTVTGALTWSPPPSPWLVWPAYVALTALAVLAGALARSPRRLAVLMGVGAVAVLWHAAATPAPPATVSSHAAAIIGALLPAGIAVLVTALAIRAARRGRGVMTGLLAVVLGWLFLVEGLPDIDVLWSAHVLSSGPQLPARLAVGALVALGPGLVLGGIAAVRRFREAGDVPAGDEAGRPVPVG